MGVGRFPSVNSHREAAAGGETGRAAAQGSFGGLCPGSCARVPGCPGLRAASNLPPQPAFC